VVEIIRKADLPQSDEVPPTLRAAAAAARGIVLREPRPVGFPLLFTRDLHLIEPAIAFLHEHGVQRAHTADTVRTYLEILYDWFDALEQSQILWSDADAVDLVAYRNRMLKQPSAHTGRPYSIRTINHRVRGVLRFYAWAVRNAWLSDSPLVGRASDYAVARRDHRIRRLPADEVHRRIFLLRQFESLPRPLTSAQARELLARLSPPYDLMARWQLYTGLRVSELLSLTIRDIRKHDVARRSVPALPHHIINVTRKGRKPGYVIASESLLEETTGYLCLHRSSWLQRAVRRRQAAQRSDLFLNRRGSAVKKNSYQQVIHRAGEACGFKTTTHQLRATFACMMLARLERLEKQGAAINPLLIVKILMGHEHIQTTSVYLRTISVETHILTEVLDSLLTAAH
jgi:integrase/recombinase XerD